MMNEQTVPKLLTSEQAAELLGVNSHTLAVWRCEKRYPLPYVKCGRWVRYRAADVAKFIDDNMQVPA
ncbi:helix-turn-helix domain-containing protein [Salinisphaera sp. SWV1]